MKFKDLNKDEFGVNVECGFPDSKLARLYGVSDRTILRWRISLGAASRWVPERGGCGTISEYQRGCRCSECRAANTASHRSTIAKMRATGLSIDDERHGTYTAYTQWGCRCEPCRLAGVAKNRAYAVAHRGDSPEMPRWTEREEDAVRSHSPAEAARITGRTLSAVYQHRLALGITKRHAQK